jgi:RNA-directed DNA polymerase
MQKSYECDVATRIGPESCGAARESSVEALTGERVSRETSLRDADALGACGRPHRVHRYREVRQSPARSETLCTYGSTSRGNREIPCSPKAVVVLGRVGKSKDVRR